MYASRQPTSGGTHSAPGPTAQPSGSSGALSATRRWWSAMPTAQGKSRATMGRRRGGDRAPRGPTRGTASRLVQARGSARP